MNYTYRVRSGAMPQPKLSKYVDAAKHAQESMDKLGELIEEASRLQVAWSQANAKVMEFDKEERAAWSALLGAKAAVSQQLAALANAKVLVVLSHNDETERQLARLEQLLKAGAKLQA